MIKLNKDSFSSPLAIFIIYIMASGLAIMGFRFFIPGAPIPLEYFSLSWRLTQGFLQYIDLFPALVLTALVIPFGFKVHEAGKNKRFSPQFFMSFKMPIVTAIVASSIYGLLLTFALPFVKNYEANILYQSRLYNIARTKARESAVRGEWAEAAQLLAISERIWPNSPETAQLRNEVAIRIERLGSQDLTLTYVRTVPPAWPESHLTVGVTEALTMAETAFAEERFFDAHWLATLGSRLAQPGSPELATANRIAGRAWSAVNSMAPTAMEIRAFQNFALKREGYEAMLGGNWIRAYYIFRELSILTPTDPDVIRFLALSEEGVSRTAFFIDEIELALGQILTGALFSFPFESGRMVMRLASLSTAPDYAYGIDAEIMTFDRNGRPIWAMTVPYIKILPLNLNTGSQVTVFLRALDRYDENTYWGPEITTFGQIVPGNAELTIPVSWESFLLLSDVRRGLSGLSAAELLRASDYLGYCGYLPQLFQMELLERFARPLFFLPIGIFTIALGWQYRALKRPRYIGIPMLGILPLVFYAAVYFCRSLLNNLGVWAVVSFGFATAAIFFAIGIVVMFVLSLIVLASRHS